MFDPTLDEEALDLCDECGEPLPEADDDAGFCGAKCRAAWEERQRKADEVYVEALMESARMSDEWRAESAKARGPAVPGQEGIPMRLRPTPEVALMMMAYFKTTPKRERA